MVAHLLGRGRIEGAERDIVGARLARLHREMAAVVAGHADLRRRAEHRARLARIAVALAEMHAVRAEPLRERDAVVDDERDVARGADRRSGSASARSPRAVDALQPELERRDRPGIERRCRRSGSPRRLPAARSGRAGRRAGSLRSNCTAKSGSSAEVVIFIRRSRLVASSIAGRKPRSSPCASGIPSDRIRARPIAAFADARHESRRTAYSSPL